MKRPSILICNDDGIHGPGLPALISAMRSIGAVTVAVPDQERSAASHCLTLHKPIRIRRHSEDVYALNGSPADCVRYGVLELLKGHVDLVVSGINRDYNLGQDVSYSGTVAAAMEASLLNIPAIAFSMDPDEKNYHSAAAFAKRLAKQVLKKGLPQGICLNVNFPLNNDKAYKPGAPAKLGRRIYDTKFKKRLDPRGLPYYWLAGRQVLGVDEPGTDVSAISKGRVSVTPLKIDRTDANMLAVLSSWRL